MDGIQHKSCLCDSKVAWCVLLVLTEFVVQGMINQRPGVLIDTLVGIPGDSRANNTCMVSYYKGQLKEVIVISRCNALV